MYSLLRPTWVQADLDAVSYNVRELKRFIGEKVRLMTVVEVNAYGHGYVETARTALASGATWLGVAILDEALLLRSQLTKDAPILVLGYVPPQHLSVASRSKITVTDISLAWVQEASRVAHEQFDFHLKVDTGLNRIGCATPFHSNKTFFDTVRCGGALIGLLKEPLEQPLSFPLQKAISVYSMLDLVKQVNASEKIGYGGTYTTTQTEWIGTVPIGYADGWRQSYKPISVLIEGKRFPIVGRIVIDQLMIGLDRMYPVGSLVTFIGQDGNDTITVEYIASEGNTPIGELLCSFSSRIPRIYKSNLSIGSSENGVLQPIPLLGAILLLAIREHKCG
ncbi:unnamed protein product [Rotaria socialis]|uniref:Alanine racemase C-terminal domain-containing protein n=1 Tax=Rotaria socialis TaxID=392032 RepID=A0A821L5R0_9BILA|nr:unnamed protein product [Rotaria socialis]CAF4746002.1 unnamed protein product [Rotaria socialis]